MKKRIAFGLLAVCLTSTVFAASGKLAIPTPDTPVHRSAILLCMAVIVGLHSYRRLSMLTNLENLTRK